MLMSFEYDIVGISGDILLEYIWQEIETNCTKLT